MLYDFLDEFNRINREFEKLFRKSGFSNYGYFPEVNIYENKDEYVTVISLPGVAKEDINLSVKENALRLTVERKKTEDGGKYYLNERPVGKFERNFMFDEKIDPNKVSAELKDGVLLVKLGKSEDAKPKAITIK